jgi:hypothetical protein
LPPRKQTFIRAIAARKQQREQQQQKRKAVTRLVSLPRLDE